MKRKGIIFTAVFVLWHLCCGSLWAASITANQAEKAVTGWLKADANPLNTSLGQQVKVIETFTDDSGQPIYYIVYLQPSGFVIVSADDLVEPIIGFVESGTYNPSLANPLGALVTSDLNERMEAARKMSGTRYKDLPNRALQAQNKWQDLIELQEKGGQPEDGGQIEGGVGSIDDVRVAPLVESRWNQGDIAGKCYNYYTPNLYLCGCVATAMAQLMRYHQYPTDGIGVNTFTIYVNSAARDANTRGGDGLGGAYDWNNMVLEPNLYTTDTQRKAIGALCYDAGVTVNMSYTSSESSTDTRKAAGAFTGIFDYGNAVRAYNNGSDLGEALTEMINPNLDAKDPVLLGITGSGGGHAVVCDGYGFNGSTAYHHLNMGWSGDDDAWYNLPTINSSPSFNNVYKCVYNVHITSGGSGEMISGRVFDDNNNLVANPIVYADPNEELPMWIPAETDEHGIYAFDNLNSNKTYIVCAMVNGLAFTPQIVTTGTSTDDAATSGNVWGIDLHGQALEITNIMPASGPIGSYIKIEGENFGDTAGRVIFTSYKYGQEVQWSDTVIYCKVPSGATSGNVTIERYDFAVSSGMNFNVTEPNELIVDNNDCSPGMENGTSQYPFSTIQRGINAATVNDKVVVMPNTYYENIQFKGVNITLTSVDPNDGDIVDSTVIDGNDSGTVVTFNSGEGSSCVISGFSIRNGSATYGGGIYCSNGAPTIKRCHINGNTATVGGGICTINYSPTIEDCQITYNSASDRGGGVYFYTCQPIMQRCLVAGNLANYGGGIYLEGNLYMYMPYIENCLVTGNAALMGGGIFNMNSNPYIEYCDITDNSAAQGGGGIFVCGGNLLVGHDILWGNTAPAGTAVLIYYCGTTQVSIGYCNIQGGLASVIDLTGSSLHWHATNINANPLYMEEPDPGPDGNWDDVNDNFGNLHINIDSPCIDKGDPCFSNSNAVDYDSRDRIIDGDCNDTDIVDIGAYEFGWVHLGDFAGGCDIDSKDYAVFGLAWHTEEGQAGYDPNCDISIPFNRKIGFEDFAVFCDNWLTGK